jgi:hypothetical protein
MPLNKFALFVKKNKGSGKNLTQLAAIYNAKKSKSASVKKTTKKTTTKKTTTKKTTTKKRQHGGATTWPGTSDLFDEFRSNLDKLNLSKETFDTLIKLRDHVSSTITEKLKLTPTNTNHLDYFPDIDADDYLTANVYSSLDEWIDESEDLLYERLKNPSRAVQKAYFDFIKILSKEALDILIEHDLDVNIARDENGRPIYPVQQIPVEDNRRRIYQRALPQMLQRQQRQPSRAAPSA